MLNFGGINFHLYGLILGLGILVAREVAMIVARERKLDLKVLDKIVIIGLNGSGKSTFANKLGKKLNREVVHLDKIYYESGWKHLQTQEEWRETVGGLVSKEKWIIDGHYNSTLNIRIPAADTIIFFDFSKFACLYRVIRRAMDKTQPFDKPEGNFNRLSWNLIKKIIIFKRGKILTMLEPYKSTKKVFIVRNDKEVSQLLKELNTN